MEGLTRLVTESLVRHGFDRPLDYRRLHWSRWFRCESPHSLLFVPSKPGVFALAEEIMGNVGNEGVPEAESRKPEAGSRMLAVSQFFESDDMAFTLDRMLSYANPMRARLASGRYFVRFVVIEEDSQRHGIANALNQWIVSSAEKVTGIGSHFASSLELTPATEFTPSHEGQGNLFGDAPRVEAPSSAGTSASPMGAHASILPTAPQLDPGAATNINCPPPFPSGF